MTVLNMGVCNSMREEQLFCSHVGLIGAELKINVPCHRGRLSLFIRFTLPTCPIGVTCYGYKYSTKRPLVAVSAWVSLYISEWGKPIQEWNKKTKKKPWENLYLISDWNKKGAHTHTSFLSPRSITHWNLFTMVWPCWRRMAQRPPLSAQSHT